MRIVIWHKKMKYTTIILILLIITSCLQNKRSDYLNNIDLPPQIAYIANPNKNDTLCISEIKRAQEDIANGKIVLTQSVGLGTGTLRYESELRKLCKENGLQFDVDLFSCVEEVGQTQGCYGAYMDKTIIEKFGIDFKNNIHRQADSLFLQNADLHDKVVQQWGCDERPRLPSENERTNDYLTTIKIKNLKIENDGSENGEWPFFDLSFIVEKDSTINGFYISYFASNTKNNEKLKQELYEIAVDYIKENYPIWIPGKIEGIPVRTDNNVRIFFENNNYAI